MARRRAAAGGLRSGAGSDRSLAIAVSLLPTGAVDRWRKRRRYSRFQRARLRVQKTAAEQVNLTAAEMRQGCMHLRQRCLAQRPRAALMDALQATRPAASLLCCRSGNMLILLDFSRHPRRGERANLAAEFRGGNVTRLSKTSAPPRIAIYLPEGIRISTRRTLLSGGFCHDARDGALPGDAGRLIRTESLD